MAPPPAAPQGPPAPGFVIFVAFSHRRGRPCAPNFGIGFTGRVGFGGSPDCFFCTWAGGAGSAAGGKTKPQPQGDTPTSCAPHSHRRQARCGRLPHLPSRRPKGMGLELHDSLPNNRRRAGGAHHPQLPQTAAVGL
eukprot:CAMPEP_0195070208 /NCGR_PEP_ID=MMETSP0448-20130528/14338_1 /TAXON_ID=66468 /ORGANISM="Heterocapsa triquestra, Strain CCMP 448" /LENGTH=135 /DNA_ID=CAMNT_0040101901 /DNA_START=20 /DNA_END=423 /DNA_ORIENTATION=-